MPEISTRTSILGIIAAALVAAAPLAARAQSDRPILAVFAHPDDERVIGPLLSRLAREGRETHLARVERDGVAPALDGNAARPGALQILLDARSAESLGAATYRRSHDTVARRWRSTS